MSNIINIKLFNEKNTIIFDGETEHSYLSEFLVNRYEERKFSKILINNFISKKIDDEIISQIKKESAKKNV